MMNSQENYNHVSVLIVGGGPAGLSAAIALKGANKDIDVVVLEKGNAIGSHNLSGAVIEARPLKQLLDEFKPDWEKLPGAEAIFSRQVDKDDVSFLYGGKNCQDMTLLIKAAKKMKLAFGDMDNHGNHIVSISELSRFLGTVATSLGVEIHTGFSVREVVYDKENKVVTGVWLVDQGLDREGNRLPNYTESEQVTTDFLILAEGPCGLVTEDFVEKAGMVRASNQLYSVGVKNIIKVSDDKYKSFGDNRVAHTMGYPLWGPISGPAIFGGGFAYSNGKNQIALGIIAGADWKYCNFNPQRALEDLKQHSFISQYIDEGELVEAGVKIIPEGGYYAIPRSKGLYGENSIGCGNAIIVGDSAGFVNMRKIKGLHNAIESGMIAGKSVAQCLQKPNKTAEVYTELIEESAVMTEMRQAKDFRAIIAKFGQAIGMPLTLVSKFLPNFETEKDYQTMTGEKFQYDVDRAFDKAAFAAMAATEHREEQPSHLKILDHNICNYQCSEDFERACITFCPAAVYEEIEAETVAANPSNCLHCKTCHIKCPFDNIRWVVPEGAGGPRYKQM